MLGVHLGLKQGIQQHSRGKSQVWAKKHTTQLRYHASCAALVLEAPHLGRCCPVASLQRHLCVCEGDQALQRNPCVVPLRKGGGPIQKLMTEGLCRFFVCRGGGCEFWLFGLWTEPTLQIAGISFSFFLSLVSVDILSMLHV